MIQNKKEQLPHCLECRNIDIGFDINNFDPKDFFSFFVDLLEDSKSNYF